MVGIDKHGANVVEALAPCTLTQQDAALNFTIGKGDGKLNPSVAQNVCEKLYINVHPHPALEPGALFGISRLEITRQLSDANPNPNPNPNPSPSPNPNPTPSQAPPRARGTRWRRRAGRASCCASCCPSSHRRYREM